MAGNLPDVIENNILDATVGTAAFAAPTTPMKVRLMTANGSDAAAGTEVTGGTYTPQTVTFGSAAAGTCSNSGALNFTLMPAATIVGVEIWDSAGTPKRFWYGALTSNKTVGAGDTFQIPAGQLTLSLD